MTPTGATGVPGWFQQNVPNPANLINGVNALVSADITRYVGIVEEWLKSHGPEVLIGVLLVIIMVVAAREFIIE